MPKIRTKSKLCTKRRLGRAWHPHHGKHRYVPRNVRKLIAGRKPGPMVKNARKKKPTRARSASNGAGEKSFGLWEGTIPHIGGKNGLSWKRYRHKATMPTGRREQSPCRAGE